MNHISVVIITFNEEKNIERCLKSVQKVADEIIVVDSFSTDNTQSICEHYHVRFIKHVFNDYIEQKTWAIGQATNKWILLLDADEAISEELCASILNVKETLNADGYRFSRTTFIGNKPIKHGRWYPDSKIRLFDRYKAYIGGINPHDYVIMNAGTKVNRLRGTILHYSFDSFDHVIQQSQHFATLSAQAMYQQGKKISWIMQMIKAGWAFCRSYIFKLGFLDGELGFKISRSTASATYQKYEQLRKLQTSSDHQPEK